jgi:hypothetical protein
LRYLVHGPCKACRTFFRVLVVRRSVLVADRSGSGCQHPISAIRPRVAFAIVVLTTYQRDASLWHERAAPPPGRLILENQKQASAAVSSSARQNQNLNEQHV